MRESQGRDAQVSWRTRRRAARHATPPRPSSARSWGGDRVTRTGTGSGESKIKEAEFLLSFSYFLLSPLLSHSFSLKIDGAQEEALLFLEIYGAPASLDPQFSSARADKDEASGFHHDNMAPIAPL